MHRARLPGKRSDHRHNVLALPVFFFSPFPSICSWDPIYMSFFFLQMRELFCPPRACSQLMEVCMSRLQVFYQGQHLLKVLFQH